jgi:Domain of unknown function (DUF4390)
VRPLSLCFFLVLSTSLAAAPPTAHIEDLSAIAANGKVSVRFKLDGAFDNGEMIEALKSGLPTSFTYDIDFFRDRPNWFDDGIARIRVDVICTYNSLTREYLLNYRRDRHLVRSETYTDLDKLEEGMTRIDEPDLFDVGKRKPYKLKVRVKADFMRGWLMYVIPWEVSTRWKETRVKTAEP